MTKRTNIALVFSLWPFSLYVKIGYKYPVKVLSLKYIGGVCCSKGSFKQKGKRVQGARSEFISVTLPPFIHTMCTSSYFPYHLTMSEAIDSS